MVSPFGKPFRLLRDERGGTATLVALSLPVLIGAGALGVDVAHLYSVRGALQSTADAAARAGAHGLPNAATAESQALRFADYNTPANHGSVVRSSDIDFGNWDADTRAFTAGGAPVNAIRVVAAREAARGNPVAFALAPIFGTSEGDVRAEAIAAISGVAGEDQTLTTDACVLALAEDGTGITVSGTAKIDANDCGFAANSVASQAMGVTGNARVDIASLHLTGGLFDNRDRLQTIEPPLIDTGERIEDPFAGRDFTDFPTHVSTTAREKSKPNGPALQMQPGIYPDGFNFQGAVDMAPGVYVMKADVRINSQAVVDGMAGVTIVMDNADIDINGQAEVNMRAPTGGSTAGMTIMRQGETSTKSNINGTSTTNFDGAIYMPGDDIRFSGTSNPGGCLQVIAKRVTFIGSTAFANNCERVGGERINKRIDQDGSAVTSTVSLVQ